MDHTNKISASSAISCFSKAMTPSSSSSSSSPAPPYDVVRQSCKSLLATTATSPPVTFDSAAADMFVASMDVSAIRAFGSSLANDANLTGSSIAFASIEQEAAFIVLLHALDFGSGWRQELHAYHGKGAWLTIKPGVEAIFCANPELTADFLEKETTCDQIAEWFGLLNTDDGKVPNNLQSLVDLIQMVLHELGGECRSFGGSLVHFTKQTLQKGINSPTAAGDFVAALVEAFPLTFNDCYRLAPPTGTTLQQKDYHNVYFYKKAQLVVGELYHRFRNEDPTQFRFADGNALTAYVDNVICAALRYKGIVCPDAHVTQKIEDGVELPQGSEEEIYLRASALVAIEYIVDKCCRTSSGQEESSLTANELGNYLWGGLGKEPIVRTYQRHATKTVFY